MSHPCLEGESASKLDDPGIVSRRDLAKRSAGNIGVRLQELSVVKDVEKLGADLQGCVLGNFCCLGYSHVKVCASRAAQNVASGPEVAGAVHADQSKPLRDIRGAARAPGVRVHPNRRIPLPAQPSQADGALQTTRGPTIASTAGPSFPGVGAGDYGFSPNAAPPDTNLAVGATQVVQIVNESFAVFDKTTGAIAAGFPKAGNTLWAGFGDARPITTVTPSCNTTNSPIVGF